jgi:hypothetical protein
MKLIKQAVKLLDRIKRSQFHPSVGDVIVKYVTIGLLDEIDVCLDALKRCNECGGTGTVNTFVCPPTSMGEHGDMENWPGPCPKCNV